MTVPAQFQISGSAEFRGLAGFFITAKYLSLQEFLQ
jgi:hypothetical protein